MAKREDKQQQIQELLKQAETGTKDVFESDKYREYLSTMSKFHNYSFRNTMLIMMQKPEASYIAGYTAWQTKFKRQVQRGEKGIQIVGYAPKNIKAEEARKDQHGNIVYGADGKAEMATVTRQVPYFVPVYVYDISQTEGEPLPQLVNELDGSVTAYNELLATLHEVSPFPIEFEQIEGRTTKGYADLVNNRIVINEGMSQRQTIKTAIHEITHADLHAPELNLTMNDRTDRRTQEVEAESTAFVVCAHYGINTSDYTFPYLANWSSSKELKELQSSLDRIQKQAADLIDRIDTRLSELQKEREQSVFQDITPEKALEIINTYNDNQDRRRTDETLDSLKFDNDIDLDREKTPEQLGFRDNSKAPIDNSKMSMAERFADAKSEAERRNNLADKQQQKETEREV